MRAFGRFGSTSREGLKHFQENLNYPPFLIGGRYRPALVSLRSTWAGPYRWFTEETVHELRFVTRKATFLEVETFGESRSAFEVSVDGPLAISDCVDE